MYLVLALYVVVLIIFELNVHEIENQVEQHKLAEGHPLLPLQFEVEVEDRVDRGNKDNRVEQCLVQ